jgi:hypothetical protein
VADFTRDLLGTGYTVQTTRRYDAVARHLARWLAVTEVTVADLDETVIGRFARHRCRCFGQRGATHVSGKYLMDVRRVVELLGKRGVVRRHSGRTIELHGRMVIRLLPELG